MWGEARVAAWVGAEQSSRAPGAPALPVAHLPVTCRGRVQGPRCPDTPCGLSLQGLGQLGPGTAFQRRLLASAAHQVSSLHLVLPHFGGTWGAQGASVGGLRFCSDARVMLMVPKPGPGCRGRLAASSGSAVLVRWLCLSSSVCSGRPPTPVPSDGCHCRPAVGAGPVGVGRRRKRRQG